MSSSSAEGRPGPGCSGDLDSPLARSDAHGPLTARVAKLLAVNVGLPIDVPWRAATVHTGIWKRPVEGPRFVRRLNIDGDGQGDLAGHGGEHRAVLVYQIDSYRYWQEHLGRSDFTFGQFGENFTVDGLPDDEVCIGDRYRVGDAVFEVSQPRVTCYRLGIRMEEPRMAALLVSHRRPGFYLRVVTEGHVQAGDDIVKVGSGPEAVTVADVDGLLYLPDHPRERLARALRVDALSPGWKASLAALSEQAERGAASGGNVGLAAVAGGPPPAWPGFRPLTVAGIDRETSTVTSLRLTAPDGSALPAALAGQYLTVRLVVRSGETVVRSYSLSGPPGAPEYRISVKREAHGVASRQIHTAVVVGQTIEAAAPRGTFTLAPGSTPVMLVSAGVGVTPVLAMLHALVAEGSTRPVWWVYGTRNGAEHAFAAEVRGLLAQLPGAHAQTCYSAPSPDDRLDEPGVTAGHVTGDVVARLGVPVQAEVYLCGPERFMAELLTALTALGFDPAHLHTETFGTLAAITPGLVSAPDGPPRLPDGPEGTGPAVTFARSGLTMRWGDDYGSLLELAEACRVPVRWSCRTGVCHTCETGLLSGTIDYEPEPIDLPAPGNVLVCCARPRGDLVVDL
jgi:ferredoxin-NADP reductase/MOSC domain-containing protein YiiM